MNSNTTIYPDDWNNKTNTNSENTYKKDNIETNNKQNQTNNIFSGLNPNLISMLIQKDTIDMNKLIKSMLPNNSALSTLLPLLQTKKTAKAVSSQSITQNKIDISNFTNVKDYYR